MELFVTTFSLACCHFILPDKNILLSTVYSDTLSLCAFNIVRDRFSHQYKTTGKLIILVLNSLYVISRMSARENREP
jgi:hypothetical protein